MGRLRICATCNMQGQLKERMAESVLLNKKVVTQKENVLILGGSYFAGRIFVEELLKKNRYNIFVFNRGNVSLNMACVTEIVGDRHDAAQIVKGAPPLNWHAVVDFCGEEKGDIAKILEFLPGKIFHYIYVSTASIYENTRSLPVNEDAPKLSRPQPELGALAADYALNKWRCEQKLQFECPTRGIVYTCLRPVIIYGPYNYAPRETYFFDLISNNEPVIVPDNDLPLFNFLYVVDLAKVIQECLGNRAVFNQAFNICSEQLVSYQRLMDIFEEICSEKINRQKMGVSEIEERQIPLPFPLDSHLIYSGTKLQRLIGIEYTPIEDGMKATYEYYKMAQNAKKNFGGLDEQPEIRTSAERNTSQGDTL